MGQAKEIRAAPIAKKDADALIIRLHYSHKTVNNGLRAIPKAAQLSIALRMIKKHYPHIEWVISFADGCQCGDGTIYRAAGFVLTGIKLNKSLLRLPDGSVTHKMTQVTGKNRAAHFAKTGGSWAGQGMPLDGYQMRYIYFLNSEARAARLQRNPICGDRAARRRHVSRNCAWQAGDGRSPIGTAARQRRPPRSILTNDSLQAPRCRDRTTLTWHRQIQRPRCAHHQPESPDEIGPYSSRRSPQLRDACCRGIRTLPRRAATGRSRSCLVAQT
ncbi:hypothetical protein V1290_005959 [Bradyrhizobium sp. AZCC 1578]